MKREPNDCCKLWIERRLNPLKNRLTAIMFLCIGLGVNEGLKWLLS